MITPSQTLLQKQRAPIVGKGGFLLWAVLSLSGCGAVRDALLQGGGGSLNTTVQHLQSKGFPKITALVPNLPDEMMGAEGMNPDENGRPQLYQDKAGVNFFGSDSAQALTEAKWLSVSALAESKRLHFQMEQSLQPVLELLSTPKLFSGGGAGKGTSAASKRFVPAFQAVNNASSGSDGSLFDELTRQIQMVFEIPNSFGKGGPTHLVLSRSGDTGVRLEAMWPTEDGFFETGLLSDIELSESNGHRFGISFAPRLTSSFLAAQGGKNDAVAIKLRIQKEETALGVNWFESGADAQRASALEVRKSSSGIGFSGGFFRDYGSTAPKGMLSSFGKRQWAWLNAALTLPEDQSGILVTADTALASEEEFAKNYDNLMKNFGVDYVLTRHVVLKFREKADSDSTSIAYYTCKNSISNIALKLAIDLGGGDWKSVDNLCTGSNYDTSLVKKGVKTLREYVDNLRQYDSAGTFVSSLDNILKALEFGNSIYFSGQKTTWKNRPTDFPSGLETLRSNSLLSKSASDEVKQQDGKTILGGFRRLTKAELGTISWKADGTALSDWYKANCEARAKELSKSSGKSAPLQLCQR